MVGAPVALIEEYCFDNCGTCRHVYDVCHPRPYLSLHCTKVQFSKCVLPRTKNTVLSGEFECVRMITRSKVRSKFRRILYSNKIIPGVPLFDLGDRNKTLNY